MRLTALGSQWNSGKYNLRAQGLVDRSPKRRMIDNSTLPQRQPTHNVNGPPMRHTVEPCPRQKGEEDYAQRMHNPRHDSIVPS